MTAPAPNTWLRPIGGSYDHLMCVTASGIENGGVWVKYDTYTPDGKRERAGCCVRFALETLRVSWEEHWQHCGPGTRGDMLATIERLEEALSEHLALVDQVLFVLDRDITYVDRDVVIRFAKNAQAIAAIQRLRGMAR